jgi:uncharacterized protein (DUF2164 family)
MEIKLKDDRLKTLTEKVQVYFRDEHDNSIGELKAALIIDFFTKELGAEIYNQAIGEAHDFMQDKLIDMEQILYVPEQKQPTGKGKP